MTRSRVIASVLAAAVLLAAPAAQSQTMSFADAADRLMVSCGKDIEAHCRGVNLGSGRLANCLRRNAASVTPACKQTGIEIFAGIEKRAAARVAVLKTCDADARRLCGSVTRGDGQILECMLMAERAVSARCNKAISDAGYR